MRCGARTAVQTRGAGKNEEMALCSVRTSKKRLENHVGNPKTLYVVIPNGHFMAFTGVCCTYLIVLADAVEKARTYGAASAILWKHWYFTAPSNDSPLPGQDRR